MKKLIALLPGIVFMLHSTAQNTLDRAGLSSGTPAASAYSLRLLSSSYAGSAIKVRRSSDNALQDIGFTASGLLDTASLKSFIGANNGTINTWYDQSGNARNLTQATVSRQPTIIAGGVIYRRNGLPSVYHDNSDDGLSYGTNYLTALPLSVNIVAGSNSGSTSLRRAVQGTNNWLIGPYSNLNAWYANGWNHSDNNPWSTTKVECFTVIEPASTVNTSWRNGISQTTNNNKGTPNVINTGIIGAYVEPLDGYISEIITFASELNTANRQALEGSQNSMYNLSTIAIISQPDNTSQIYCVNAAPTPLNVNATGTGTLSYQWYSNTANSNTGGTSISGATSSTYTPVTTAAGTLYYYVVVSSTSGLPQTSNVSGAITVNNSATYYQDADGDGFGNPSVSQVACSQPVGYVLDNTDCNDAVATIDPAVFGINQWNVYAYNGFTFTNYYGYYIDNNLNFNTETYWNSSLSPSAAAGYVGCAVPNDNHSYRARRKGFPSGCYTISILTHDDYTTLYIDGVQVFQHAGCCDAHPAIWTGHLDANSTVEIATQEAGGGSNAYYTFSALSAGAVSGDQSVCNGTLPADISLTSGSGTIQWQSSLNNISFSDIPGATSATLAGSSVGAITAIKYVRAIATNGSCADTSAVVTLTPQAGPAVSISGATTAFDSVSLTASGGVSYLWTGGNSPTSAANTITASGTYKVFVTNAGGCTDSATTTVTVNLIGLNKYGAITFDSTVNVNENGAIAKSGKVDKNGKKRNAGREDGLTAATAGRSAYQIKQDYPAATDGFYWIKNTNINGGAPVKIYADMTTNGGGWTLIMCNASNAGWTYANAIALNTTSPSVNSNYSIIGWADYIKKSTSGFQYMIDANQRNKNGAIWTANGAYSFVNSNNSQTNITINVKFGTWTYNDGGIEQIMPWYSNCSGYITTSSACGGGSWWGTLISNSGWTPAPWIAAGCGVEGCMQNPGIIWYWVR